MMLKNRVAFITGAANGIGLEIAKVFAKEGAKVVISDIDKQKVKEVSLSFGDLPVIGVKCDASNEKELIASIDYTIETFGRLDILVNNAGLQYVAPIEEFPTERFEEMLQLMVSAPFVAIKHVFPTMKKQGFGRIINVASINGLVGYEGKAGYNTAKHGAIGLTKVAALEGAEYGITVNAICPGYVDTALVRQQSTKLKNGKVVSLEEVLEEVIYPLVPQKRLLEVEEVANYTLFLVSEKAKGVTGQAVVIDGGYTIR